MKKKDLVRPFERNGWWLQRHGTNHDIYTNGRRSEPIPRHSEIKETLAQAIIRRQGLK